MQSVENPSLNIHPLLTITIPTYNRANFLGLCLKRINEEIVALTEDLRCLVNVYVSDNASLDDTHKVIAQYQHVWGNNFVSVRNTENIGPDANIAQCYELAKTPYVWLIGDDDVLLPGGLKKVLDVLINNEVDLLYVNNYWFSDSYKQEPMGNKTYGITTFESSLSFARYTNVMLTYLSGLIVRSGIGASYRDELAGSNLVQLSWVLPLLRDGKRFMTINDFVIAAKGSNSGGYGLINVFGNGLKKITDDILKDKPLFARAIQNGTIVNFFPGFILEFRKGSSKFIDKDISAGLREAFGSNWRYYVFLVPLVRLPMFIANYYNFLLRVIRRIFNLYLV